MKPRPIRIGDKVRVLRPRYIRRIGYPLIWYDLVDEVEKDPRVGDALRALGYTGKKVPRDFQVAVAKLRVQERGFGGRVRSIHHEEPGVFGHFAGVTSEVYAKRLAKTGVYFPPRSGVSHYDGEQWYEPGGLDECKTHIILTIDGGEIEACDVELVGA